MATEETGKLGKAVDEFGNKALYLFGAVERYFKKAIVLADKQNFNIKEASTVTLNGLRELSNDEKDLIAQINRGVDLFAYDYDNINEQLRKWRRHPVGGLIKPFIVWPYKAMKHFTGLAGAAFDPTIPRNERLAKLLALATLVTLYAMYSTGRKKEQQTPAGDESTPAHLNPRGRLMIAVDDEGREIFVKTSKYPFIGITDAGIELASGRVDGAIDVLNDAIGSLGPVGEFALIALGYESRYAKYVPVEVQVTDKMKSFIPLFRTLQNVSNILDPYVRRAKTPAQALGSLVPTTDPVMQDLLHGEPKKNRYGHPLRREWQDALLYALTGILTKRIDPNDAEQSW